ncbi:TMEM1 family protein-like protein [Amylocarpus encephaloides]|uniref:TMEM1 family protein-like protein n=1 Tax=Amylocarpus encephaloides TaxID=45428 RepID=A0A9P8C9B7_9HELO|nr:TMEM1 family protein-like protein [Amylocarpus encephaloides]
MEQPSSSSKVTVEYFDPHGVYQLLSPGLLPRLPLHNLHWESHAGPLRSIDSLHIDLVPGTQPGQALRPVSSAGAATSSNLTLSKVKSEDSTASGGDGFHTQTLGQVSGEKPESRTDAPAKPAVRERRHQIPGLRQTPYLKIFFLRCDDNETYKAQARREVREWIKEHTPPTQSSTKQNTQENHDAYEWMIIHVVVPNTAAATQPRSSGKINEGSSGNAAEKTAARWRGGGSSTILEKLRADFNGSSRSATDRVSQIRIGINDVPYDMLPRVVPAIPGSYTETPQENENAWIDFIAKLKFLILASFDLRVGQYEEDIREKDTQRSLPGWNFCTFFVLKEGLARGFESVGLVEDALVGYDELAVGLDAIVREQTTAESGPQPGGSFLPYTQDLMEQAKKTKTAILSDIGEDDADIDAEEPIDLQSNNQDHTSQDIDEIPVDATKKHYRELILSNNISIFDFRCYIFARQLSLLLRLANAWSSQEELLAKLKEQRESSLQGVAARFPKVRQSAEENLVVLAEICSRALDFVASIARILRDDIWSSQLEKGGAKEKGEESDSVTHDPIMGKVVDNMASSFTFAVAQQILAQTATKVLPIPPSTLAPPGSNIGLDGQEPKASIPEPKTMMHPARTTSLAVRSTSRESSAAGGRSSSVPETSTISSFNKPGLEKLAGHRAELYLLSRNVMEQIGKERGWGTGWEEVSDLKERESDMEEVDLTVSNGKIATKSPSPRTIFTLEGIKNKLLRTALDNEEDFLRLFETLTDKALRHYTVAGYRQSVLSNMADLAILKYHQKDFAAAASYFVRMTPSYGEGGWSQVEISMLILYAKSLKELQRKEEYVRVVLKLLSKAARNEKERQLRKSAIKMCKPSCFEGEEMISVVSYLDELLHVTKELEHEITIPLRSFFGRLEVDGTAQYDSQQDSFSLQLHLRYLLSDDLTIDEARMRINASFGDTNREIWLKSSGPTTFKKGRASMMVKTDVIVPGIYTVGHVSLHVHNLTLDYEHGTTNLGVAHGDNFFKSPKILLYHRAEAFDLKLHASRYMHLDRNRSLELEISTGWNDVKNGELHIRAATAGMRIQTSEASVVAGSLEISRKLEAGVIRFGPLATKSSAKISMPFNLEHDSTSVSLKIEISYTTEKGTFFYATLPTMSILLPLGVNVQDVFKHNALFSKFTISSATSSPLRLLSSRLEGSEVFDSACGVNFTQPVVIFPRQPASMLYKITKKSDNALLPSLKISKPPKSSMSLVLHYVCLEEEIDLAISTSLNSSFQGTPLQPYSRLLIPTVVSELQSHLTPFDLEKIAVLSEVSTSYLANIKWKDRFLGLGRMPEDNSDVATIIAEGLQAWQHRTPPIPLTPISMSEESIAACRSIVIPVDVPRVTVVHTADLKFAKTSPVFSDTAVSASNQPIPVTLHIKWTRKWDIKNEQNTNRPADLEFFYEVSGPTDTWLIGGKRKGHFKIPNATPTTTSTQDQNLSFPVVLIPLREGHLPFPNVDIKPAPTARIARSSVVSEEDLQPKQTVACETDYRNAGETIRVISNAWKTTVSLDASGPQGGAMLLESEGRSASGEVLG